MNDLAQKSLSQLKKKKVKEFFAALPPAKELSINHFYEQLLTMKCMLSNYYDYLEFQPMNVNEEMKRIDTVDLLTAFAILTMVFREDHFSNGSIIKRIEDGTLDKIIDRINLLYRVA